MRISQENVNSRRTKSVECTSSYRPQAAHSLNSFPKSSRILKRQHFKEIGSARNRFFGKFIVIDHRTAKTPKLGITVVKQYGCAVKRNRFKRLVREAFRHHQHQLAPIEMIIMPKKGVEDYSLEHITQDLLELTHHVAQSRAAKSS